MKLLLTIWVLMGEGTAFITHVNANEGHFLASHSYLNYARARPHKYLKCQPATRAIISYMHPFFRMLGQFLFTAAVNEKCFDIWKEKGAITSSN